MSVTINNARILDIGEHDAFYPNRDKYIGLIGTFAPLGDITPGDFYSGHFIGDDPGYDFQFYEVKIAQDEAATIPVDSNISDVGKKSDDGKLRMDLITPEALEELAKVLGYGAKKYGDWNWSKGINYSRVTAAVLRHINSWRKLEDNDPETGLNHLSHAFCGLMFLITYISRGMPEEFDDRIAGTKVSDARKKFKPYCYDCGAELKEAVSGASLRATAFEPCKSCIKVSYDNGYEKGIEDNV